MGDVLGTDSYTAHLDALLRDSEKDWPDYGKRFDDLDDPLNPFNPWRGGNDYESSTNPGHGFLWDAGMHR